jgi:hypothetical protein
LEHWQEMECRLEYMQAQVDEANSALARQHLQQQDLEEKSEAAKAARDKAEEQANLAMLKVETLNEQLVAEVAEKNATKDELSTTQDVLTKTTTILLATQRTEERLAAEAKALINAVSASVADGDELHALILENRDVDVERRLVSREFQGCTVELLGNALKSLSALSDKHANYSQTSRQFAERSMSEQMLFVQQAFDGIQSAFTSVENAIAVLTASMTAQDGLIPVLERATLSVATGVEDVHALIIEGEKKLTEQCVSTKEHLVGYLEKLCLLEKSHEDLTSKAVCTVERQVAKSVLQFQVVVKATEDALGAARLERAQRNDALKTIIDEWKTSASDGSKQVCEAASHERFQLIEALEYVHSEMHRFDDMTNDLLEQGILLDTVGSSHIRSIQSLGQMLEEQKHAYRETQRRQKEACDVVVSNLLNSVTHLVEKQMSEIVNIQKNDFANMLSFNDQLAKNSLRSGLSASEMIDSVKSVNTKLRLQVDAVKANELQMAASMETTKGVFDAIANLSTAQQAKVLFSHTNARENLVQAERFEQSSDEIAEKLQTSGHGFVRDLKTNVLTEATQNIRAVSESGNQSLQACKISFIPAMHTSIDKICVPRREVIEKFGEECSILNTMMSTSRDEMTSKASVIVKSFRDMWQEVSSREAEFEKHVVASHSAFLQESKQSFIDGVENHQEFITTQASHISSDVLATKATVQTFVKETIHAHEAVNPAPERKEIKYSTILSSTPFEDAILGKVDKENGIVLEPLIPLEVVTAASQPLKEQHSNQDAAKTLTKRISPHGDGTHFPDAAPITKRARNAL